MLRVLLLQIEDWKLEIVNLDSKRALGSVRGNSKWLLLLEFVYLTQGR